jgi:hypothetical protein
MITNKRRRWLYWFIPCCLIILSVFSWLWINGNGLLLSDFDGIQVGMSLEQIQAIVKKPPTYESSHYILDGVTVNHGIAHWEALDGSFGASFDSQGKLIEGRRDYKPSPFYVASRRWATRLCRFFGLTNF